MLSRNSRLAMKIFGIVALIVLVLGMIFLVGRAIDPDFLKKTKKAAEAAAIVVQPIKMLNPLHLLV